MKKGAIVNILLTKGIPFYLERVGNHINLYYYHCCPICGKAEKIIIEDIMSVELFESRAAKLKVEPIIDLSEF